MDKNIINVDYEVVSDEVVDYGWDSLLEFEETDIDNMLTMFELSNE